MRGLNQNAPRLLTVSAACKTRGQEEASSAQTSRIDDQSFGIAEVNPVSWGPCRPEPFRIVQAPPLASVFDVNSRASFR